MRTHLLFPLCTQIVEHCGLFAILRLNRTADRAESLDETTGSTAVRQVVFLACTVENITETIRNREILIHNILRSYIEHELCLLHVVLVVTLTVLQYPIRIRQSVAVIVLSKQERVGIGIEILSRIYALVHSHLIYKVHGIPCYNIGIRAEERSLNKTQYIGRRNVIIIIV